MNYLEFLQGFRVLVEQLPNWDKMSEGQKKMVMKIAQLVWRIMTGKLNYWGVWYDLEDSARTTKEEIQEETR